MVMRLLSGPAGGQSLESVTVDMFDDAKPLTPNPLLLASPGFSVLPLLGISRN